MSSTSTTMVDTTFSKLTDDIILQIFFQLQDDPRNWARLSCACTKFNSLITCICCKSKCISFFNSLSSDLLSLSSNWASLYKIAVCCPGLLHAGVLLANSDFGLHRELGPTEDYLQPHLEDISSSSSPPPQTALTTTTTQYGPNEVDFEEEGKPCNMDSTHGHEFGGWSLYDDLYYDTVYDNSETSTPMEITTGAENLDLNLVETTTTSSNTAGSEAKRRRVKMRLMRSHLASGGWSLSREQGNKLLGSRFRDDCLYISEWPGCVHIEEKRNYRLFRGIFHNFKRTRVWRTLNDGNRSKIELNCAFCSCKDTWDLHSAFCLKRGFGFHDDGEPVVRAYVCENGHVSGAWTDLPLYA